MTVLVLEDGTGVPNANAYVTGAEVGAIIAVNPTAAASWAALTPAEQDDYAIWASNWLDDYYNWVGTKTFPSSGMRWPRTGVADVDGIPIPTNAIPAELKQAVAEMAIVLLNNHEAAAGTGTTSVPEGIKRVKADVVEVEFFSAQEMVGSHAQSDTLIPARIRFLLRAFGNVVGAAGSFRYVWAVR